MALDKQMDLFQEGGMIDEGGDTDPISGNDVPVGSLKKEVRDDIPAQLSEGEFVMPADVVRYHGLDKMMALRDEAKSGLQRMEDMGQMGNSEEATIPDGIPFNMDDLELEDEPMEMQVGGFVPAAPAFTPGNMQQSQFANYTPQYTPYQMPQYTAPTYTGYQAPQQAFTPMAPTQAPTFTEFVRPKTATYVDGQGNEIQIPVGEDGTPLIPVPPGYTLKSDTPVTTDPTPDPTQQQQQVSTQQQEEDPSDGREFGGGPAGMTMNQSKISVLKQLDPSFAQTISSIDEKYKAPQGLASLSILGGIGREFKRGSETRAALRDYDYDKLAADSGLTREELDSTLQELTGEVFSGYRDPVTGEVSGQKDPRSAFERGKDFLAGIGGKKEEDFGDEFGNIADDGTMPTTTGVETARVTGEAAGKTIRQTAEEFRADEARRAGLAGMPTADQLAGSDVIDERIIQTANALMARDKTLNSDDAMRMAVIGETQGIDAVREYLASPKDDGIIDAAFAGSTLSRADDAVPSGVAASIARSQRTKPEERSFADRMRESDRKEAAQLGISEEAYRDPDKRQAAISEAAQSATETRREKRIREEAVQHEQRYRDKGYSSEKAKKASMNKARADNEARDQTGERQAKAVTDRHGNPVRSASDGSVVTSNREEKDDSPEPDSRWCCSQMVHRGLWTQQYEFARLTVWSSKQPDWWKSGYHVWGKVLAKTFLRKKGFWTDVMQSFYDYHIRKKPYTWRTALAHVMVYPGVFICGNIWTKQPKGVTLASFKELNG